MIPVEPVEPVELLQVELSPVPVPPSVQKKTLQSSRCDQRDAGSQCSAPAGRPGEKTQVLRALPHTHSQTPSEEHVQQVLHFMRDLEAKAFANDNVPGASKLLVHGFFDHLCSTLGKTTASLK